MPTHDLSFKSKKSKKWSVMSFQFLNLNCCRTRSISGLIWLSGSGISSWEERLLISVTKCSSRRKERIWRISIGMSPICINFSSAACSIATEWASRRSTWWAYTLKSMSFPDQILCLQCLLCCTCRKTSYSLLTLNTTSFSCRKRSDTGPIVK